MDQSQSRARADDATAAQRRRLPASERRAVILDAALRTFATSGYDGAAMDQIATAAGVSKAVVYDHFSSKRELYTVLLNSICADLVGVVELALEPLEPGGEARVMIATDAFFTYVEENPEASRLLILELQGAIVSSIGRDLEVRLVRSIASRLDDARLFAAYHDRERQLEIVAELLKSAVQGLATWWFRHPETPREELVYRTVQFLWPAIERAGRE